MPILKYLISNKKTKLEDQNYIISLLQTPLLPLQN